jgi:hypothetical protein
VPIARTCLAVGHVYFRAGAYPDAREAYLDALHIFDEAGVPRSNLEVRATIADVVHINNQLEVKEDSIP